MTINQCPFCEQANVKVRKKGIWRWVQCKDCGGRGTKALNRKVAITHWNHPTNVAKEVAVKV